MSAGRKNLCPSGNPEKFKGCLAKHPQLKPNASPADVWWVCDKWKAPNPPALDLILRLPKNGSVPSEKVHAVIDILLSDSAEIDLDWPDVLTHLHHVQFPELPEVYRKIAGALGPHTKGVAYFFLAAAEIFDDPALLRETAAGFARLDARSYDADVLQYIEDRLIVAGLEDEALMLAERFLPIMRKDELMPYSVP